MTTPLLIERVSPSAIAIMDWVWQLEHEGDASKPLPAKTPYQNETHLIKEVKAELEKGLAKTNGEYPRVLIIGALGRCGRGALNLCRAVGVPEDRLLKWDLEETKPGGPFVEIRESDVSFVLETYHLSVLILSDLHKLYISVRRGCS